MVDAGEPIDPKLMLSIGAKSDPFKTYGYLIGRLTEGHRIHMRCTGISALHAATKSLAMSRTKIRDHSILRGDEICVRMAHQEGAQEFKVSKYMLSVDRVPSEMLNSTSVEEEAIRCSSKARPKDVGGNIFMSLDDNKDVVGKAMGQQAVATLMAGYAIARKRMLAKGTDVVCFPEYREEEVTGKAGTPEVRHILNIVLRRVAYDPLMDVSLNVSEDVEKKKTTTSAINDSASSVSHNDVDAEHRKKEEEEGADIVGSVDDGGEVTKDSGKDNI